MPELVRDSVMERRRVLDDYEPGPIPPPRPLDIFGFIKQDTSTSNSAEGLVKSRSTNEYEREARRVRKWRKMIGVGGSDWKHYLRRKPHVVKRRIREFLIV